MTAHPIVAQHFVIPHRGDMYRVAGQALIVVQGYHVPAVGDRVELPYTGDAPGLGSLVTGTIVGRIWSNAGVHLEVLPDGD